MVIGDGMGNNLDTSRVRAEDEKSPKSSYVDCFGEVD
jgi:hypothetical protein